MLPDFLVIGAMKAGTTSLFRYLADHPDLAMPWQKEVDFFTTHWEKGVDWYEAQFDSLVPQAGRIVGEVSPNYSKRHLWPETAARVASVLPDAKIVYVIRDPIARLQSMYVDMRAYGGETRSIDEAISADDDYVLTSSYGYQLEPYVEVFGDDRLLVIEAEDLLSDRERTVSRVYSFVGAGADHRSAHIEEVANVRSDKLVGELGGDAVDVAINAATSESLRAHFAADRRLIDRFLI